MSAIGPVRLLMRRSPLTCRLTAEAGYTLFIPIVHSKKCTGCGRCEHSCVLDNAAIKVLPIEQARGELGKHYRLGWEEKEKAGGSLIPEQLKLPVRRPEVQP
jgi:ferredoxin-type protein NapG